MFNACEFWSFVVGHFRAVPLKADDKSSTFKLQFIIPEDENKKNPVL